ncbi:sensor histidine kinase [Flocculibacter collagenilyticus]|uniref:sensor histidine kinase n=1 Tax=Flocculibacter collagenilyticus TaxID=2744479 RepID=UPI0018F29B3D|nr:HAMP domain-containing sensor histidine kinase [Flocculibacter collagenilyticus]
MNEDLRPDHNSTIDFSTVLASAVHDMKNSLCMLIQSIDQLSGDTANKNEKESNELAKIHYEASRLNTNLLQLLSLYRAEKNQLPLMIEEHYLDDICDEVIETNRFYIENRDLSIELNVQPDLAWYMDGSLIANLLNDIIVNALRYTKTKIKVSAHEKNNQLVLTIEDDGDGYPQSMLEITEMPMQDINLNAGRTGLGLFFARMIASAHTNKGKCGEIALTNGGELGGSTFTLTLP